MWANEKNITIDSFMIAKKDLNRLARHIYSPDGAEKLVFVNVIHEVAPAELKRQRWTLEGKEFSGIEVEKFVKVSMRYPTMPMKTRKEFELLLGHAIEYLEKSSHPDLAVLRGRYLERVKNFDRESEEKRANQGNWRSYQRFVIESGIDLLTIIKRNDRITSLESELNDGLPFPDSPNWKHFDAAFGETPADDLLSAFALYERASAVRDPAEFLEEKLRGR